MAIATGVLGAGVAAKGFFDKKSIHDPLKQELIKMGSRMHEIQPKPSNGSSDDAAHDKKADVLPEDLPKGPSSGSTN